MDHYPLLGKFQMKVFKGLILSFLISMLFITTVSGTNSSDPVNNLRLTEKERIWLKRHPDPRIGVWVNVPPYAFPDNNGNPQGIFPDYLKEIENYLKISFQIIAVPSFAAAWDKAMNKELDLLVAVTPSERHLKHMNLSQTYHVVPVVLVTRSDMPFVSSMKMFNDKKVVAGKGHVTEQWIKRDFPEIQLIPSEDYEKGLRLVSEGTADAYVGAMAALTWQINKFRITNLKIAGKTPYQYKLSIAARKDWPEFIPIVNKALDLIQGQKQDEIYNKWVMIQFEQGVDWFLVWKIIGSVAAISGVIFSIIFIWNRRLQKLIIEKEKAENELRESQRKLHAIFDHHYQLTGLIDTEGILLAANNTALNFAGVNESEVVGRYFWECPWWNPSQNIEVSSAVKEAAKGEFIRYETTHLNQEGQIRNMDFSLTPVRDDNGEVIYIIPEGRDITEIKDGEQQRLTLQSQLAKSQKMESIGNLAGGIAHDFNNILASIIGFTELVLDETKKGTPIEDSLQEVYAAGKRAKDLVKQILAFARQSDEKIGPIQPSTIAKEVMGFIRSTIPTTIEIQQEFESEALIMGNATQVHQVLMNLCTNAAYAMEDSGGRLSMSLRDVLLDKKDLSMRMRPGGYVEIKVSDTGLGIAPENIESIFEPYFTTKDPGEGTGMGLAMVQGVVESYGGQITVDSQLEEGTTFTIHLPISKKRLAQEAYVAEKLPTGTERILFVDDEAAIAKMVSQILERLGYSVTTRTSSNEALGLFQAKPNNFDLVITDMTMPNITGDNLAVELMKVRPDIPVILCTGYSKKISDESATDIGIKAFAFKPIVKADLARTVRQVLDEAKSEI